jgi:hypothetical protein
METKIKHKLALDFIFGGKSLFTVKNPQTGNRFTFKVKKSKENDVFLCFSVLTNGDNIYEYIGYIKLNSDFKHSTKSRIGSEVLCPLRFSITFLNHSETISYLISLRFGIMVDVLDVPEF